MPSDRLPDVRTTLSALWVSLTLCFLYADVIGFYAPGALERILAGKMGAWPVSQSLLLGVAGLMAAPPLMVVLSFVLTARIARLANISIGAIFLAITVITMIGAWRYGQGYYLLMGAIEVLLTGFIVWYAWHWPPPAHGHAEGAAETSGLSRGQTQ